MIGVHLLLAASLALLVGCSARSGPEPLSLERLSLDAAGGSELPNLVTDQAGRAYLSWVEPVAGEAHALKFAMLEDAAWGASRRIAEGDDWFVNFADFPSMAVMRDGTLAAHWLRKSGVGTYAYDVVIAFSRDRGESWSEPVVPHTDATPTEHGFVSLLPWAADRLFALWLDGRHFEGLAEEDVEKHAAMTLRYAILRDDGSTEAQGEVDSRTCSCCQTAATAVGDDVMIAYRDRSEQEIRDITLQRLADGSWSGPQRLHDDGWKIDGCPVNGPALDARGEHVAAAWFTGADGEPRVYLKQSGDGGRTFGKAVRIDGGQPLGRVDVATLADGSALVLWMERSGDAAEIRLRRVTTEGQTARTWTVVTTKAERDSGFPRMTLTASHLVLAWTEIDEQGASMLRSARAPWQALLE